MENSMNRFLILALTLIGFSAFGQSGSLDGKAAHLKLQDSTQIVTPVGYGTLAYFPQDNGGTWKIWENGVKYDLKKFGAGAGTLAALGDVNIGSPVDADLLQYRSSDSKWHNFALSGDVTVNNTGVSAIGANKVTNSMLFGGITYSKLSLTGSIL